MTNTYILNGTNFVFDSETGALLSMEVPGVSPIMDGGKGLFDLVRVPHIVLIAEHDVAAAVELLQQVHKVVLGAAEPLPGAVMGDPVRMLPGQGLQQCRGAVGGAVIGEDQMEIGKGLAQNRVYLLADKGGAVVGCQQNIHLRQVVTSFAVL